MNASQRRQARRATARAMPLGAAVVTPRGTLARVYDHGPRHVHVQLRNGHKQTYTLAQLQVSHGNTTRH